MEEALLALARQGQKRVTVSSLVIRANIWLGFSHRKTTTCYLGWRFGDWRWSSGPESVVGCFFDTDKTQACDILEQIPGLRGKMLKRAEDMLCRSTGAVMQDKGASGLLHCSPSASTSQCKQAQCVTQIEASEW